MLVSSFNLSQSFNYAPYFFAKNGSNQRSVVSVCGPWKLVVLYVSEYTRPASRQREAIYARYMNVRYTLQT
jgi:hypothetical protein